MIKVLVVDDSALMRRVLADILSDAGDFEVDFARDGLEALEAAGRFAPDVITLDVQMPRLDGLQVLDRLMVEHPRPVVMISAHTKEGADATLQALDLGAVDFLPKPAGPATLHIDDFAPLLVEKVRAAAGAKLSRVHRLGERLRSRGVARSERVRPRPIKAASPPKVAPPPPCGEVGGLVLIGASTGGPPALETVLGALPGDFPWPVLVAQHMPATFTGSLARRLDGLCEIQVAEVAQPTPLQPGHAYIARGDADMIVSRRGGEIIALPAPSDPDLRWHPSVDRLCASARAVMPPERMMAALLTGMGDDGAAQFAALRADGGRVIAQSEASAVVWGMPGSLARLGGADALLDLVDVGARLVEWAAAR